MPGPTPARGDSIDDLGTGMPRLGEPSVSKNAVALRRRELHPPSGMCCRGQKLSARPQCARSPRVNP